MDSPDQGSERYHNALLCVINFTAFRVGEKSEKNLSFLPTTTDTFLWDNNGVDIGFANQTFSVNLLEGTIVPDYYPTIQSAINGVNSGDTILVRKGTYHENVVANKTVALLGEDRNGTIIDGNGAGYVVGIKGVNNVSVCNFTIQNGQTGVYAGDWGTGAGSARGNLLYNVIKNNTGNGIYLDQTGYFVSGNDVANNGVGLSIYGQGAVNGTFRSNGIENNSLYNLELNSSAYDQIDMDATNLVDGKPVYYLIGHVDETVPSNAGQVTLVECSNIVVQGLELTKNSVNLQIVNSVNCTVRNTNSSSADIGILLLDSKNCILSSNALADCRIDLQILESQFNNVIDNVFQISGFCGVDFGDSANNSFYHNTMNRVGGASMVYRAGNNTWDNGYPSGGNYWSDYAGVDLKSGPNQNINGSDGIGDTPYVIDANNTDHYPLMAKKSLLPVHDIDTGLDYATLQAAINAPETLDGNRIHVDPGTYYEHLAVNKSVALIGDNSKTTIIDGSSNGTCVNITANNVNLTGFTVRNSGSYPDCGVIVSSTGNAIEHNIIENNDGDGIDLLSSSNWNILISNDVMNNNGTGILVKGNDNTLNWNNVSNNNYYGVLLQSSWNDTLNNNTVMGNDAGICIWSSSNNNTLNENNVTGNNHYGIWFEYSSNNTLAGNKVTDNGEGVLLQTLSSFNTLIGNDVENSHNCGLEFVISSDNKIYHNNFVNDANVVGIQGLVNLWDNGYPSGGNYWNSLNGSDLFRGVYQNETGSDGIIDTAYVIAENNTDHFPLTKPYAGSHDIGVVTVDTSNNTVGHTHLWIYAEVINYGEQTETFNVTVMANSTIVQRQAVTLTARNSTTITFVWNTTTVAQGQLLDHGCGRRRLGRNLHGGQQPDDEGFGLRLDPRGRFRTCRRSRRCR